jgi:hypothetical protein
VSVITNLGIFGGQYGETPGQFIYTSLIAVASLAGSAGTLFQQVDYNYAGNQADGELARLNSGGTGERSTSLSPQFYYYEVNTNRFAVSFEPIQPLTIRGVASRFSGPWDNRSADSIRNSGAPIFWQIGAEVYYPPTVTDGTPSSAFGFSAPGGTQANPSPSTFVSSVAVNSGQTYSINVGGPQGGFVQFQFVQG